MTSVILAISIYYTLKRNSTTSPSFITYSLPSLLRRPFSLTLLRSPSRTRSSNATTSARMNPRSKSLCILPAAPGALVPLVIVQALTSLGPAVKKLIRPRSAYPDLISLSRPLSSIPRSSRNPCFSSPSSSASSEIGRASCRERVFV